MAEESFVGFKKRDGLVVPFDSSKIKKAISKAAIAAVGTDSISEQMTPIVLGELTRKVNGDKTPTLDLVQDTVQSTLKLAGYEQISECYEQYRKLRQKARDRIAVKSSDKKKKLNVTDKSLLLVESREFTSDTWDRGKLIKTLQAQTNLDLDTCIDISKLVENKIIEANWTIISTAMIRELTNMVLLEQRHQDQLKDSHVYHIPKSFVDDLMDTKSDENSNIGNNSPEAVNLAIAELVLKQWGLDTIFSEDVKRAHAMGEIHLHDLGYPDRVYCSSHSLEYIKKYGMTGLLNLNTTSKPANSAGVLCGHLNTFLASMQASFAGALGISYLNIFYAPYLVNASAEDYLQRAQELIFNGSQCAFSRGNQTLFLDFNIHANVPEYLRSVPAIGPGGKYMLRDEKGNIRKLKETVSKDVDAKSRRLKILLDPNTNEKVLEECYKVSKGIYYNPDVEKATEDKKLHVMRYGDYEKEAQQFAIALLEIWKRGDANNIPFSFPKCDFHCDNTVLTDPASFKVFMKACELAKENGSTYFVFDRDSVTLSACCRLKTTIDDDYMLKHVESMRFCGVQNVTINIPQAAYRAVRASQGTKADKWQLFLEEIDHTLSLCVKAHLQKKEKLEIMMSASGKPLWQIGKIANDGLPYVNLDESTYIIGLLGVNDAMKYLFNKELHEDDEVLNKALELVAYMYFKCNNFSKRHSIRLSMEESPAESATRRLARTDLNFFPEAKDIVKGGNEQTAYYTNSIHLTADFQGSIIERIRKQSMFHSLITSGAINHIFIQDEKPDENTIAKLIQDIYYKTQAAQVTISPTFTICCDCNNCMRGDQNICNKCGSKRTDKISRVVGYFSRQSNWNESKKEEAKARLKGNYKIGL